MAVQMDRNRHRCFQRLDHLIHIVRRDHAGHVLDTDRVGTHVDQFLGLADVVIEAVNIAAHAWLGHRVAHATLEMLAALLDLPDDRFEVAIVVQRIEGTEDIHAVFSGAVNEGGSHVVGVVAVAHQILGTQQHGKRRLLGIALERTQTLPRIFVQETVHGVERGTTPGFQRPETDFIHHFGNRDHVLGTPTRCEQGLVSIAQGKIHDLHRIGGFWTVAGVIHCGHYYVITHFLAPLRLEN